MAQSNSSADQIAFKVIGTEAFRGVTSIKLKLSTLNSNLFEKGINNLITFSLLRLVTVNSLPNLEKAQLADFFKLLGAKVKVADLSMVCQNLMSILLNVEPEQ